MTASEHLPAQLAELMLNVSRRLALLDHDDSDTVPLGAVEAMVMRHVDAHPGVTPSQISARLGLKSSNTSAALRDLETKGFIRRGIDPADGRGVRVDPTPLARRNLARKRARWNRQLSPHLPNEDALAVTVELLTSLDAALEVVSGSPPTDHQAQ